MLYTIDDNQCTTQNWKKSTKLVSESRAFHVRKSAFFPNCVSFRSSTIVKVSKQVGAAKPRITKIPKQGSQEQVPKQGSQKQVPKQGSQEQVSKQISQETHTNEANNAKQSDFLDLKF